MARTVKTTLKGTATPCSRTLPAPDPVAAEIAGLAGHDVARLRQIWLGRWRTTPPPIRSADVLMRLMAWRLQAAAWGDLDRETRLRLAALEKKLLRGDGVLPALSDSLGVGTVLTRDWRGTSHAVEVVADGFRYEGTTHTSLSEIARGITGTRWSGPRFFGLEEAGDKSAKAAKARTRPAAQRLDGRGAAR